MNAQAKSASNRVPTEDELREVFCQVVGVWAKLAPQDADYPRQMPPNGAVERKVVLSGPGLFHLVVRIPPEFGSIIGRLFSPGVEVSVDPEDAFTELVNMYCGHLKNAIWGNDVPYKAHLPEKSGLGDWPKREADVYCFLRIGAFPVEILLWDMARGR